MSCRRCLEEASCIFVSVWSDGQRVKHIPCSYAMKPNGTEKDFCCPERVQKPGGSVLQLECGHEHGQCTGKHIADSTAGPWPTFSMQTLTLPLGFCLCMLCLMLFLILRRRNLMRRHQEALTMHDEQQMQRASFHGDSYAGGYIQNVPSAYPVRPPPFAGGNFTTRVHPGYQGGPHAGLPPPSVPEMSAVYGSQPIMVGIPHRPGGGPVGSEGGGGRNAWG